MSKIKIDIKGKYFIQLYNEWDKIVSKKKNIKKTKDNCLVCGSKKNKTIFIKKRLNFCICDRCSHVFINPFLKPKVLERHFQKSKTWEIWSKKVLSDKNQKILERKKYNLGIKEIKKFNNIRNVLDIGSSSGAFLNLCRKMGFNVKGVEPSRDSFIFQRKI